MGQLGVLGLWCDLGVLGVLGFVVFGYGRILVFDFLFFEQFGLGRLLYIADFRACRLG